MDKVLERIAEALEGIDFELARMSDNYEFANDIEEVDEECEEDDE
jgi:hypothetical protein